MLVSVVFYLCMYNLHPAFNTNQPTTKTNTHAMRVPKIIRSPPTHPAKRARANWLANETAANWLHFVCDWLGPVTIVVIACWLWVTDGPTKLPKHNCRPSESNWLRWMRYMRVDIVPTTPRTTTRGTKRPATDSDEYWGSNSAMRPELSSVGNSSHSNNTNNNNDSGLRNSEYSILFCALLPRD